MWGTQGWHCLSRAKQTEVQTVSSDSGWLRQWGQRAQPRLTHIQGSPNDFFSLRESPSWGFQWHVSFPSKSESWKGTFWFFIYVLTARPNRSEGHFDKNVKLLTDLQASRSRGAKYSAKPLSMAGSSEVCRHGCLRECSLSLGFLRAQGVGNYRLWEVMVVQEVRGSLWRTAPFRSFSWRVFKGLDLSPGTHISTEQAERWSLLTAVWDNSLGFEYHFRIKGRTLQLSLGVLLVLVLGWNDSILFILD